ncbi:metal cation transporter, ZIP family [Teladorsagia circumcincta]|uniref:Metal cation transporter, ZIP family n=1 Tax=Teladorsagia circumcincta TaxID=45464 RepID=A0A2G9UJG9_TELCI|nr:metal cation transporter, ZIP family [Teladorsagia circumcincta]
MSVGKGRRGGGCGVSYGNWKTASGFKSDYPFVPLLFTIGFFMVKIFEEIMGKFCGHEDYEEDRRKHAATFISVIPDIEINDCADNQSANSKVKIVKSLTFVVALMFHASLEGFAFGVQETTISVASLFCGIIVHKAVVSFSVGMRLIEAHPNRRWLVVTLICIVALVTPIGGTMGIILEDSAMNGQTKDAVTCVLLSLALGTFIYITFFEVSHLP